MGLKEKLQHAISRQPQEPLPPPSERVVQVMNLLSSSNATIKTRVPIYADMWQQWARELAEKIVDLLPDSEPPQRNTLSRPFGEIGEKGYFIMGYDADKATIPLGAIVGINGHHEVYRKISGRGFNLVDKTYYALPADCPVIPIFMGSNPLDNTPR